MPRESHQEVEKEAEQRLRRRLRPPGEADKDGRGHVTAGELIIMGWRGEERLVERFCPSSFKS